MGRTEEELGTNWQSISQIGATIRAWRRYRKLSLTDLAVVAGFGQNGRGYISKIEHGLIKHIGESRLNSIAEALQISSTDLLDGRLPEGLSNDKFRDLNNAGENLKPDTKSESYNNSHDRVKERLENLDQAIVGNKILLRKYDRNLEGKSLDWARTQLKLAELYRDRANYLTDITAKDVAIVEAQRSIEQALSVFTKEATPGSFNQAKQLLQEIEGTHVIDGYEAWLRLYSREDKPLDWARTQLRLSELYRDRANYLTDITTKAEALTKARNSIEQALSVFTNETTPDAHNEAVHVCQEIKKLIAQLGSSSE